MWALARSNAPAGAMLAMRPRDLLAFAQMHLNDGAAADGTQVLAPETVAAMQEPQVDAARPRPDGRRLGPGLGALRRRPTAPSSATTAAPSASPRSCGSSRSRAWPSRCSPTAATRSRSTATSSATCSRELADVDLPALPEPARASRRPIDAGRYVGTYSAEVADLVVTQDDDGRIWLEHDPEGDRRGDRREGRAQGARPLRAATA